MSEASLLVALGENIKELTGEDLVVRDYILVAEVLDDEGYESLRVSSSNANWVDDLKMIEYARELTRFRMRRQWTKDLGE